MIMLLIASRNRPKVIKVMGMVRMSRTGLRNVFKNDKTKATINAAGTPEISTPGKISAVINTARADTKILTNQFFMFRKC